MAEINSNNPIENGELDIEIPEVIYEKLPGWKGKLQEMNDKLVTMEKFALFFFIIMLCSTAFLQWILRSFFSSGYVWLDELIKYSTLWAGFIGASIATSRVAHFRIDLIRMIKNRTIVNKLRALTYFAAVIFCVIFAYATIDYITTLIEYNEKDYYGYPVWPIFTVVFYFYTVTGSRYLLMGIFKLV